jgi:hypothetical protein
MSRERRGCDTMPEQPTTSESEQIDGRSIVDVGDAFERELVGVSPKERLVTRSRKEYGRQSKFPSNTRRGLCTRIAVVELSCGPKNYLVLRVA